MTNILALHTSTHDINESTSAALTREVMNALGRMVPNPTGRVIDTSKLHIVQNLSCYANGKMHCADPKSGKYRCWAHVSSLEDPKKYGGVDQMSVIYDALEWGDIVLFSTSTRWGNRSALCQRVIERMNTLENRAVAYGEPYPLKGKKLGVVVTGTDWRTGDVANQLVDTLRWWGFATTEDYSCALAWQRSMDPYYEQPDNNRPTIEKWMLTPTGAKAVHRVAAAIASGTKVFV